MIIEIARSHVRAQFGDKTVTVEGEGYSRGYGSPDFVLYSSSLEHWDAPYEHEVIDDAARCTILSAIKKEMESEKRMTVEIE